MNDLQQSKRLLEDKIALTSKLLADNEKSTLIAKGQLEWLNESWVKLNQELWKDQAALNAVNEEINEINETPTLAFQKTNPLWKEITAVLVCLLLTSFSCAQIGFHFEYSNKYKAGYGLDIGHNFNKVYIGTTAHVYFTRLRSVPAEADLIAGYSLGQFQPFISGGFYTCGKEAVSEKEGTRGISIGGGLAYQFKDSPVRLSAGMTGNNIFLTVGLFKIL